LWLWLFCKKINYIFKNPRLFGLGFFVNSKNTSPQPLSLKERGFWQFSPLLEGEVG
jgi:hypothetical protein